tara:strand:+ start:918 stop:3293 length:2376 start_codon:yes stop_codon:yes gene_type:complete
MSETNYDNILSNGEESFNIKEFFEQFLFRWKWFVIGVIILMSISFLYLRYTQPVYSSNGLILIKDEKKGGAMPDMAVFEDLGVFGSIGNLENEIQVLKSRKITTEVVKALELNKKTIIRGDRTGFKAVELYAKSPISIRHNQHDSLLYDLSSNFEITILDNDKINIEETGNKQFGTVHFGNVIETSIGNLIVEKNSEFNLNFISRKFEIKISTINQVISDLIESIKIKATNKDSYVLSITSNGPVIDKNNAIINELIRQHANDQLADKNQISKKTRDFIQERMEFISKELTDVDNANLRFKKDNGLINVSTDAQILLAKSNEIEKKLIETNIQLNLVNYMSDFIQKQTGFETLLPSNLGIEDRSVAEMISNYNKLVLERNKLLLASSEFNPLVNERKDQLINVKYSIENSLKNIVTSFQIELSALNSKTKIYDNQLSSIPGFEKEYRDIFRQQQIKETLYLYLLQKREENEIALSANVANTKIIDHAFCNEIPISPNKKIIYLGAFFLGLLFPAALIYVLDLFDNKVHSQKDLEKYGLPHLANIPLSNENEKLVAQNNPRSVLSEAFRILRTNVAFLFSKEKRNTIFVTSTIAGEGKTFVSLNVAHSLALTGKKVCVIGLDLRAPKLLQYLELQTNLKGVSNYIIDPNLRHSELTIPIPGTENLFLLPSGITPPNPSELLLKPRFEQLMNELKDEYDYIIADTAPVSLVTDTLTVAKFADVTLYVTRANKLDKRMLEFPAKLYAEKKLNNMSVIVNAVDMKKGGSYGYGYGYGYGDDFESDKKKWYQFWKK